MVFEFFPKAVEMTMTIWQASACVGLFSMSRTSFLGSEEAIGRICRPSMTLSAQPAAILLSRSGTSGLAVV